MLSIRDEASRTSATPHRATARMQGHAPDFTITDVTDFPTATGHGVENIREVTGTYRCRATSTAPGCPPGGKYTLGAKRTCPKRTPG